MDIRELAEKNNAFKIEQNTHKKILFMGVGNLCAELAKEWQKRKDQQKNASGEISTEERLAEVDPDVMVLKLEENFIDAEKLTDSIVDKDVIVYLVDSIQDGEDDALKVEKYYIKALLEPAQILVNALAKKGDQSPHFIFISTLGVYGTGQQTSGEFLSEEMPVAPADVPSKIYAEAEKIVLSMQHPATLLRVGTLYDHDEFSLIQTIKTYLNKNNKSSGFSSNGFFFKTHMEDLLRAIDLAANQNLRGIFNVCENIQEKTADFFDSFCKRNNLPKIEYVGSSQVSLKKVDCSKIKSKNFIFMHPHVLLIGSGELATYLIPDLTECGYYVTATTTTPEKLVRLKSDRVNGIVLEGTDKDSVEKAMKGKEVIIVAVAPKMKRQKSEDTYKKTSLNVVKGWLSLSTKPKVVYISAHFVYSDSGGKTVTEESPILSKTRVSDILKTSEQTIMDWIPEAVALRLGWLLSQGRPWKQIIEQWNRVNYEIPGTGKMRSNLVHIKDASRSIVFAINKDLSGIYNVCNDAHPYWGDLFNIVGEITAIDAPKWTPSVDEWFEGDHIVSSEKIKSVGFVFNYPREIGLSFLPQDVSSI